LAIQLGIYWWAVREQQGDRGVVSAMGGNEVDEMGGLEIQRGGERKIDAVK